MDVSWIGVVVGALAYYVLGAAWFTPLFGGQYDRALGVDREDDGQYRLDYYIVPLVSALLVAAAIGGLAAVAGLEELVEHVLLGVLVGAAIGLPISVNNALNPATPRPYLYGLVTGTYHLTGAVLVGAVIGAVA